ncbi:MAG TPA: SDR family NAD(P)-dependent oxidoreductase [Thermoanaerobaculia bacterium]|jgi:3-oxoacyl-[acyl-carrier protein] reductase
MKIDRARALVTGGSSGIGFATAKLLAERGARVAICGRDREKLERAAKEIGATGIAADVAVESDCVNVVAEVVREFDDYNVLVNNAGFGTFGPLLELDLAEMQRIFATNVFGAMVVARESARHFVKKNYGNIVNVASSAALRGFAGGTAYAASKFALHGMTECWRAELRKSNVRVMQVNPSEVQTEFFRGRDFNPRKLVAGDIAQAIVSMLELDDRGFVTEMSVWATNP